MTALSLDSCHPLVSLLDPVPTLSSPGSPFLIKVVINQSKGQKIKKAVNRNQPQDMLKKLREIVSGWVKNHKRETEAMKEY